MKNKRSASANIVHNDMYDLLQTEYLQTRNSNTLGKMYEIARRAAHNYLFKYCIQKGISLNIDEKSHDSAVFVIEQYLTKPSFRVEKLSAYIYFGVLKNLFRDSKREQMEISYEQFMQGEPEDEYGEEE